MIKIEGDFNHKIKIPQLSIDDFFRQKLSAFCDRGLDKNTYGRDFIDLTMLIKQVGEITEKSWNDIAKIYNEKTLIKMLKKGCELFLDRKFLEECKAFQKKIIVTKN